MDISGDHQTDVSHDVLKTRLTGLGAPVLDAAAISGTSSYAATFFDIFLRVLQ